MDLYVDVLCGCHKDEDFSPFFGCCLDSSYIHHCPKFPRHPRLPLEARTRKDLAPVLIIYRSGFWLNLNAALNVSWNVWDFRTGQMVSWTAEAGALSTEGNPTRRLTLLVGKASVSGFVLIIIWVGFWSRVLG